MIHTYNLIFIIFLNRIYETYFNIDTSITYNNSEFNIYKNIYYK